MTVFEHNNFNRFVIDNNVIGFFEEPRTLKSGRKSNWYVNWRTVTENAYLARILVDYIIKFSIHHGIVPDTFYGVPEGATKIGLLTQYEWAHRATSDPNNHVLAMGRGKVKEHGDPKDRYFLGVPKGRTTIIEDVTTTGGSLIKTIGQLQEAGVNVTAAIGLTNRMEKTIDGRSVKEAVEERIPLYYALSTATELLPLAYEKLKPGRKIAEAINKEFEEHGVERIIL